MFIVQKLYIKDFFKVFAVLSTGIALILSVIGLIDKIDDFSANPSFSLLFKYTIYNFPKYFGYIMQMAVLISSLFVFSQAVRRWEIVTIKITGIRIKRILKPFLMIGILLSLFGFFLNEMVIPVLSKEIDSIKKQLTKTGSTLFFKQGTLYMRGKDGSVVRISLYIDEKDLSYGVNIYRYNERGLIENIYAESAEWDGNLWRLKNVNVFKVSEGKSLFISEMSTDQLESPKILKKELWKPEEMTIIELIEFQNRLNSAGFKNNKLLVDISSRFSFPLINLFMLILGMSLPLGVDNRLVALLYSNIAKPSLRSGFIATGLGLFISSGYFFGHTFFLSLGYAGTVNPILSPWIMPIIFALCSIYLYKQIPE